MSVVITSVTAAYSSAHVYICVTVAGAFPVHTHRTKLVGGKVDLMVGQTLTLILYSP